jgi:N4-gp56 family major capsid protein
MQSQQPDLGVTPIADMNITPARQGLTPTIWDSHFFTEYVRKSQFSKYFGTSMSSMIQVRDDLTAKRGDSVVFPAVRRLIGAGVTGNQILEGSEELLNARSLKVTVGVIRHAVAVSDWDEQKSIIDIRDAAKDALQIWALEKMRADIILALGSMTANGDVQIPYATATAGQRDFWLANNQDRVLFGALNANSVSGVMATSLLTVDVAADKMSGAILSTAKRKAKTANPRIRPIMVDNDEEWFVCFMPSMAFRDFRQDPAVLTANTYAWERGRDNPIFTGGDLIWDGIIVREVPELTSIAGAGGGGADVAMSFLCGAQALGIAWAQRSKTTTNTRDYAFMHGVGVQEIRGIAKLRFGTDAVTDTTAPKDNGVVTIFTTNAPDA